MGLIQAVKGAINSTLADQWKEFIYCDSLDSSTLIQKGRKRVTAASSNQYGSDNIITHESKIVVNEGQALLVVENGKIIDFSVEPGAYIFKSDTEPSLFAGGFKGLIDSFKKVGQRFVYGGQQENDQRVYYVNLKEIPNNKFGVGNVPFRDSEFGFTIMLKGFGIYSFKIEDPLLFFSNVAANVRDRYTTSSLSEQLKAEFQQAIQVALGNLSATGISYDRIPQYTKELTVNMDKMLDEDWKQVRGLVVVSIGFSSITPDEESAKKIAQFQEARVYSNAQMLGGRLGGAQATAMENAASNPNGAMNGFIGMGFAQQAGGATAAQFIQPGQQSAPIPPVGPAPAPAAPAAPAAAAPAPAEQAASAWVCGCGAQNTGNFCQNCGAKRPAGCTHPNAGPNAAFCPDCGAKLK